MTWSRVRSGLLVWNDRFSQVDSISISISILMSMMSIDIVLLVGGNLTTVLSEPEPTLRLSSPGTPGDAFRCNFEYRNHSTDSCCATVIARAQASLQHHPSGFLSRISVHSSDIANSLSRLGQVHIRGRPRLMRAVQHVHYMHHSGWVVT